MNLDKPQLAKNHRGGSILEKRVNPDLQEERDKCSFDKIELRETIQDAHFIAQFDSFTEDWKKHPELKMTEKFYDMDRDQQMKCYWEKLNFLHKLNAGKYFYNWKGGVMSYTYCNPGQSPLYLHFQMFQIAVDKLASEEQKKKWLPMISHLRMVGCYAQTELGHGSNVAGLETTATFDKETDEIVIHSPTITSTKYWAGGLGRWGNHAVVFARLIVDDFDFGVQPFMVQIRDLNTHMPMPGVQVGDVGPKLGYNTKDNGWMIFDHVRIPRDNMLQRLAGIDREGNFEIKGDLRALYQVMVAVRQQIIGGAGPALLRSLTIAVRYSVCRRQFSTMKGTRIERKILDYQSHMHKLGPLLAESYLMQMTGTFLIKMHRVVDKEVEQDKYKQLDVMHHFTSGLKSLYSQTTYEGLDLCRQSCGGAGFSAYSGLPQLFLDWAPVAIFEGDNTVMAKQNSRYIMKKVKKCQRGKPAKGLFSYINHLNELCTKKSPALTVEDFSTLEHLEECLAVRAAHWVKKVTSQINQSKEDATFIYNDLFAQDIITMSKMHMIYLTFMVGKQTLTEKEFKDQGVKKIIELLMIVYALHQLTQDCRGNYDSGYFSAGASELVSLSMQQALVELRPQMVPLVELQSEEYDMSYLSCIGNEYGDIYETQLRWAQESKLNAQPVPDYYESLMKPLYHAAKL